MASLTLSLDIYKGTECRQRTQGHPDCVTTTKHPSPKPQKPRANPATTAFVANYNPTKSKLPLATSIQWTRVRPFVQATIKPLTWMAPTTLRIYLTSLVRLAVWADTLGLELEADFLLAPSSIDAFCSSEAVGQQSSKAPLTRLAKELGLADSHQGIAAISYQSPYSSLEVERYVAYARALSNTNRRGILLAIVVLGAGTGIVRSRLRGVQASDIHQHEDGATFVRTFTNCARVLDSFEDVLAEAASLRPQGPMVGDLTSDDLTKKATAWVKGRSGLARLHVDRLRATYVCSLMASQHSFQEVVAWAGVDTLDGLQGYFAHVAKLERRCSPEGLDESGAR